MLSLLHFAHINIYEWILSDYRTVWILQRKSKNYLMCQLKNMAYKSHVSCKRVYNCTLNLYLCLTEKKYGKWEIKSASESEAESSLLSLFEQRPECWKFFNIEDVADSATVPGKLHGHVITNFWWVSWKSKIMQGTAKLEPPTLSRKNLKKNG